MVFICILHSVDGITTDAENEINFSISVWTRQMRIDDILGHRANWLFYHWELAAIIVCSILNVRKRHKNSRSILLEGRLYTVFFYKLYILSSKNFKSEYHIVFVLIRCALNENTTTFEITISFDWSHTVCVSWPSVKFFFCLYFNSLCTFWWFQVLAGR